MTTPRSREEIERDVRPDSSVPIENDILITVQAILELLLDIRDSLTKKNPTDV